jgi:hypothetical protein
MKRQLLSVNIEDRNIIINPRRKTCIYASSLFIQPASNCVST